ncbi:MAG: topoisomerase DNA-binding C4 zinc finger domain-containing protein, partial [Ardenticatenaceae bacterium]
SDTGKSLAPTESGQVVTGFLVKQFPELLNLDFTKQMEDDLDRIAEGVVVWQTPLREFHTKLTQHLNDSKQALINEGVLSPCPKCEGVIATLTGKYGEYQRCLSCNYKPNSSVKTGKSCPECKKPLIERTSKHGKFVSCSGYPECKYRPLNTTGEKCPDCEKPLVEKKNKKGTFVGCSGYPGCKYIKPTNTTGENCPDCKKPLVEKKSKKGAFVGCSGYPGCKYIKPTN